MSKTYAIADLHGRFDLLEMALACAGYERESSGLERRSNRQAAGAVIQ
jgi:hypothetical protein